MTALNFLNGPFLVWCSPIVLAALCIAALLVHFGYVPSAESRFGSRRRFYRTLARGVILFRVVYAGLLTVLQYIVWHASSLSRIFLNSPLILPNHIEAVPPWFAWIFQGAQGYFLFYTWGRFWFNAALSVGAALLWYVFLKFLARHKERFFDEGEVMLGFLSALLVGWPRVTLFVPILFFVVVGASIVRRLAWGYRYTTLGTPFILSALFVLVFGGPLLFLTGLSVLSI